MLFLPFLALLLCVSILPLMAQHFWHRFERVVLTGVALSAIIVLQQCSSLSWLEVAHCLSHQLGFDYLPFLALITVLYLIGQGIQVKLRTSPTIWMNTAFFIIGGLLASFVGTTGASMILIKPFIELNASRQHKTHLIIFFIMIIANIGGCLTPFGDPPLFLGFLQGVPFFWPMAHLIGPFGLTLGAILGVFAIVDYYFLKRESTISLDHSSFQIEEKSFQIQVKGLEFALLLLLVLLTVIASSYVSNMMLGRMIQILGLVVIGAVSYWRLQRPNSSKPHQPFTIHQDKLINQCSLVKNKVDWGPIIEVAPLLLVIFIALVPANLYLKDPNNLLMNYLPLGTTAQPNLMGYYLGSGVLSSFLDNAPTYLMFFEMAGGDPVFLSTTNSDVLRAISLGSVFWGAMSYIGNAPNLLISRIASQHAIRMPSFLGYLGYSGILLLPILLILGAILF